MPRLVYALPKYRKHRASGQAVETLKSLHHYHGAKAQYELLVRE